MKTRYLFYILVFAAIGILQIGLYQLGFERGQSAAKRNNDFVESKRLNIIGVDLSRDNTYLHTEGNLSKRVSEINCKGTIFVLGGKVLEPLDLSECESVSLQSLDFTEASKARKPGEATVTHKGFKIGLSN
jgi:hypothetical protein